MVGKHAFLALLRDEGVEFLFGNPGSTELALMDALAVETAPRFILGLHEGVVMSMAHGYAATTGKLAAVNLHAAPGLGNALGMLYNVKKAHAPVLVTAGQQDLSFALREPLLWDDLATIARPFVKWSVEVTRLADLPRIVRRAAKIAMTPPMGPVFISLPGDVLAQTADIDLLSSTRIAPRIRGDALAVAAAAALIAEAERPMIFAGDSVCSSGGHAQLVALAERLGAPVFLEAMADRAAFPTSHPLFAGVVPRLGPLARAVIDRHDLILSVGGDLFTESLATDVDPIASTTTIIHIDDDAWELGKNYGTAVALLGDPASILEDLNAVIAADPRWAARRGAIEAANRARRDELVAKATASADRQPMPPLALLQALGDVLPRDVILIDESLSSGTGLPDLIALDDERAYIGLRGGGIGAGLPQAIGAKLGNPDRPVVAFVGDGSSMFSMQSLWTAAHYRIAVTFVIVNNQSYRILKQRTLALKDHAARTGNLIGMDLTDPAIDFLGLAKSLGLPAVRASTPDEVRTAIAAALASNKPRVIEAVVDAAM